MNCPGGKNGAGVYQSIINLMPPHRVYIEPFLGGGAVVRAKLPAEINIGVDLDAEALEAVRLQLAQSELAIVAATNQKTAPHHPQSKAAMPAEGAAYLVAQPEITIRAACGIQFLRSYRWQGGELVYCDPPYLMETRSSKRPIYKYEFTDDQHRELLEVIKALPCYVLISGYYSKMYTEALQGWRVETFQAATRGGRMATEYVWMNYPEPLELHDYRYLGKNYIQRQTIKRQRERWVKRLLHMPPLKRAALLSAVQEVRSTTQPEIAIGSKVVIAENG